MQAVDDALASLPHNEGRLRPRTSALVLGLAAALALVLAAIMIFERVGVFQPQIAIVQSGWDGEFVDAAGRALPAVRGNQPSTLVRVSFYLANTGWSDLRVLRVEVGGAGLEFLRGLAGEIHPTDTGFAAGPGGLSPADPYQLPPGATATFGVEVRVTDCAAVADPAVTVVVDSWRGVRSVILPLPKVRHIAGGWQVTTADDPAGIGSMRYLADKICGYA